MRFTVGRDQIKIFDPLLIKSLRAYRGPNSNFGVTPKTLGAMRELYAVTKDEAVRQEALSMKQKSKELIALKEAEKAPLMYQPKPITEDMNNYEKWNGFGFKDNSLALTDKQNIDVHFGVEVLKHWGFLFYFDEPRTGKTMKTIATMDATNSKKVIVEQLGGVLEQFKADIEDWQQLPRKVITLSGSVSVNKREAIWEEFRTSEEPMVIVVSYNTVVNDRDFWIDTDYDMAVCDEPHKKIKNVAKSVFKAAKELSKGAKYIVMLTGTPLDNLLSETYVYLNIALPRMFKNKSLFIDRYFETKPNYYQKHAPDIVTGWNFRENEIIELLSSVATNRKNLQKRPEIEYVNIPMTKKQIKMMDDLEDSGELELDKEIDYEVFDPELEQKITVRSKYLPVESVLTTRLFKRQLLAGPSALKGMSNKWKSNKLKYILKFIRSNPQARTLIFTDHKLFIKNSEWAFKKLGIKYAVIHGEVNAKKRDEIRKQLNNGELQVVMGQTLTMSTGGTFNEAQDIFFLNLPYNPSERRQASDRLLDFTDEANEGKRVMVLQHPGTMDEDNKTTLDEKVENQKVVNNFANEKQKLIVGGK